MVFYTDGEKQSGTQFATHHAIRDNGNKFELEPGSPLSVANLKKLATMASRGLHHKVEILPTNVLAASDDLLVWWMPAGLQFMHFDVSMGSTAECRQRLQGVSGQFPLPALVFVLQRGQERKGGYQGITVHALAENTRPCGSTKLYRAPLLNINEQGSVCWGNGLKPKGTAVADIAAWQSLFFSSVFTHFNISSPIKGDDCYVFIADLLESHAQVFPVEAMQPKVYTLQQLVDKSGGPDHG